MVTVLHENSYGIRMTCRSGRAQSVVSVQSFHTGRAHTLTRYRFNRIPDRFDSPYCSWENLDCCGGWRYDERYLDTAVQQGKKLFAGRVTFVDADDIPGCPTLSEAIAGFEALRAGFPEGVVGGIDTSLPASHDEFRTYICRTGKISDYFDLTAVFDFYEKLGTILKPETKQIVRRYCDCPLADYATEDAPFIYNRAGPPAELITVGLLLGYPLESTASFYPNCSV